MPKELKKKDFEDEDEDALLAPLGEEDLVEDEEEEDLFGDEDDML